jgi:hypothetical protein
MYRGAKYQATSLIHVYHGGEETQSLCNGTG